MSFEKVGSVRTKHDSTWKREKGPPKWLAAQRKRWTSVATAAWPVHAGEGANPSRSPTK